MLNKRRINQKERNKRLRAEVKSLADQGFQVKLEISMVADKWFLSDATVRDVIYDKRRE